MTEPYVAIDRLSKRLGNKQVLDAISAQAQAGEVIGLLGLNGAGKTTLLETLPGLRLADSGTVQLFGQPGGAALSHAAKLRIGFVPQRDELLDSVTAAHYLTLIAAFYPRWNHALVQQLCAQWQVPLEQRIRSLSTGQRQTLSIISALGHEPDLLLLDEPVASLDPLARRRFLRTLVDLCVGQERTVVFSTHIVSDLERVASRVWLLRDGALMLDAPLDDLKESIVRVQLPATVAPPQTPLPGLWQQRTEAFGTVLVFRQWSPTLQASLERQLQTSLAPQALGLEEIFLELHA